MACFIFLQGWAHPSQPCHFWIGVWIHVVFFWGGNHVLQFHHSRNISKYHPQRGWLWTGQPTRLSFCHCYFNWTGPGFDRATMSALWVRTMSRTCKPLQTRPEGVMFRIQFTALGRRTYVRDGHLQVKDGSARFYGTLHMGWKSSAVIFEEARCQHEDAISRSFLALCLMCFHVPWTFLYRYFLGQTRSPVDPAF